MDANWIAVDWNATNLRLWVMGSDGSILDEKVSDQGAENVNQGSFETVMIDFVQPFLPTTGTLPIICSGMISDIHAPYQPVPYNLNNIPEAVRVTTTDRRISVHILPGIKQQSPADVMRGQETQIAGFLQINPDFDGVICLAGRHTKWAHISASEIVSFQTYMTGELFQFLSQQSTLQRAISIDEFDIPAFTTAVDDAMSHPQALSSKLFGIYAASQVSDQSPPSAAARLSGLLLGAELAAARPYWLGQNVAIIGSDDVAKQYQLGLEKQGVMATITDANDMTLAGLSAAYHQLYP